MRECSCDMEESGMMSPSSSCTSGVGLLELWPTPD